MTTAELLLAGGGMLLLAGAAIERPSARHAAGVAAGGLAFIAWRETQGAGLLGVIAAAFTALAACRLALLLFAQGRGRFSAEEQTMRAAALPGLDQGAARHLLDQGIWMDGKAEEILICEDAPVTHLFYLAAGTVRISTQGTPITIVRAPTFLGELTVLDEKGATATVTLIEASRFWCVPAPALRLFLKENPGIGAALAHSFVGTLAEKLRQTNTAHSEAVG